MLEDAEARVAASEGRVVAANARAAALAEAIRKGEGESHAAWVEFESMRSQLAKMEQRYEAVREENAEERRGALSIASENGAFTAKHEAELAALATQLQAGARHKVRVLATSSHFVLLNKTRVQNASNDVVSTAPVQCVL